MPVCRNIERGTLQPGTNKDGKFVPGKRLHWRNMLTKQEIDLVESVARGGKTKDGDRAMFEAIHERVDREGWSGFRLVGGKVRGISIIPVYGENALDHWVPIKDRKKQEPGPLAPLLEEFVHED